MKYILILTAMLFSISLSAQFPDIDFDIELHPKSYYGGYDYVQGPPQDSLPKLSPDRYYLYVWYLKKNYTTLLHYENTAGKTADVYPIDQVGTVQVRLEIEERVKKGNKRIRVIYYSNGWIPIPIVP